MDGSSPALLINTTEVGTGRPRVIAPFLFAEKRLNFLPIWNEPWAATIKSDQLARNIPLSAAATASARFPWITPAAWFNDVEFKPGTREPVTTGGNPVLQTVQLVDGGYFDNSGVITALELIRAIKAGAQKGGFLNKIRLNLIVLTSAEGADHMISHATEFSAPVRALLNARVAAGRVTVDEALYEFDATRALPQQLNDGPDSVRRVELKDAGYPLPLGWKLSEMTRLLMRTQSGDRALCDKVRGSQTPESSSDPACTAEIVYRELQKILN